MALSEKSRATLYTYFASTPLGDEVTSDMLTNFPSLEFDTLVTKDFLAASQADIRREMVELRAELKTDMAELRAELKTDMAELRAELKADMAELRAEMHAAIRRMMLWMIATMVTLTGISTSLTLALH